MVKDHSDSEKGNPLPPHGLLFPISSKGSFICTMPQTGEHIPRPLLHQSWSTGWNEKVMIKTYYKNNLKQIRLPRLHESGPFQGSYGHLRETTQHLLGPIGNTFGLLNSKLTT